MNIKELDIATDYKSIFALSEFAFQYKLDPDDLENKKHEAARHVIWGFMDEEQIAAKLHLIPLSVFLNGKELTMGGVSSVATWPEYRRKGLVKQLLKHSLEYMRTHGQTVSYLYPFSFAYYRKYGWELAFNDKEYTIPIERFSKHFETTGYVRRTEPDIPLLNSIYTAYAKTFNGMLARDEKWWEDRILNKDVHTAIAYNEHDEPSGYILFSVKKEVFNVVDIAFTSMKGRKTLLMFIANHDSMVEKVKMTVPENDNLALMLDEPRFEQKENPYFMARIVDVHAFLKQFPFRSGNEQITLHVEDTFFLENTGTYQLKQLGTDTNVTFINEKDVAKNNLTGIHCSIQKLTSICLGYVRPAALLEMGLIHGPESEVKKLDRAIPIQQPFFADFF